MRGITQITVKIPCGTRLMLTIMQFVIVGLGFLLMLLVMSFNVWVFLVAVLGLTIGKKIAGTMKIPDLKRVGMIAGGFSVYNAKGDQCCTDCCE